MKTAAGSSESLLAPTALGGVLARRGMRFQDLWLLQRVLVWVIDPLFRGFVNEGREDVDTFHFVDQHRKAFDVQRWQLKDRLVTKQLLAEVLSGFEAQHRERTGRRKQRPVSRFHLVAPVPHQDVWSLPDLIDRVRHARIAYRTNSLEYSASLEDLGRRLERLGVKLDPAFVSERVSLDFRAGWADSSENYWHMVMGLLPGLDVAPSRARDAANQLLATVTGSIGKLVTSEVIVESMKTFAALEPAPSPRPTDPEASVRRPGKNAQPLRLTESHCRISYFPDEAILVQFPDGTRGLIDCGPTAVSQLVPYLLSRSITRLSFLAVSHWCYGLYGGIPALLKAVSSIDHVWLALDVDRKAALGGKHLPQQRVGHIAERILQQLLLHARVQGWPVHFGSGIEWVYRADRRANADFVCQFAPASKEYSGRPAHPQNNPSAAFLIRVAGRNILLGGHALVGRWHRVIEDARSANIAFNADGFVLPHYGSRKSLTPELIKSLINPSGSVAFLPVSEMVTRKNRNITDRGILDHVRAAGGRIVTCSGTEPMHFVMNADGLFQALSPEG